MQPEYASTTTRSTGRSTIKPPTKSEMALAKARTGLDSISGALLAQLRSEARARTTAARSAAPAKLPASKPALTGDERTIRILSNKITKLEDENLRLKVLVMELT